MDNFSSENTWVPECVLLLEWKQKDKTPEPLSYKVKLKGSGDENDFFRIVFDPGQYMYMYFFNNSATPYSTLYPWFVDTRSYRTY